VINVSSVASRSGSNAYGLTKNAVERMTAGMASEVGHLGISVNCIAPGISAFEAAGGQLHNAGDIVGGLAIGRIGASRELYEAMIYLCSDAAAWVTGQTLRIDGGAALS